MFINIVVIITVLFFSSCNKEETNYDCEELSMKFYRGLPKPSAQYVKHCKHLENKLKYSPEACKKALGTLMMTGSKAVVIKRFGDKAMGCFNQSDLERFLKE